MPIDLSTPEAPEPIPEEMWSGTPNVVLDGDRYAIGWQRFPDDAGGPAYVTARRGMFGGRRVLERYPLTGDGWARAWAAFATLAPATAEKTRRALGSFYAARPPAGMLAFVPGLTLRATDSSADGFTPGQVYDLQFGKDGLLIARSGSPDGVAEYGYADVALVQVTGFEQVVTASRMEFLFSPTWTRLDLYENRIQLRIQAGDRTLDFWHAVVPPKDYHWVETVNRAIREALLSAAAARHTEWLVSELSGLAERLERGTLTRSDFDLLKARISGGC